MAKVTGYKCDVCSTVENGGDAPFDWHKLYLPRTSEAAQQDARDICSDKCLLNFAKERTGYAVRKADSRSTIDPGLREFLLNHGVKNTAFGPLSRVHTHHANKGIVQDDCLFCEFMSQPAGNNGNI